MNCGLGLALEKDSKPGVQEAAGGASDARPACSGDFWRRLTGKVLLNTESARIEEHLYPHQLAVGVRAGAEVMAHASRQFMSDFCDDDDKVLVDSDETNAHNLVDRHTFLNRALEVAPGLCRWLEFICPTADDTLIFYRGRTISSACGGQQGCPMIGFCHALVQRILLEAGGIVPVDPATTPVATPLDPPAKMDLAPMFADDGCWGGSSAEVLRFLQHIQAIMPRLGLNFSKLEVIPTADRQTSVDLQPFVQVGCTIQVEPNVAIMKSPIGSADFNEFSQLIGWRKRQLWSG